MESILTSVKKVLGIVEEYEHFDVDIVMHINTVLFTLHQMGVGPTGGFAIEDKQATWSEFIPDGDPRFECVKTYVCQKVRMLFDPPLSSSVAEAIKSSISELEFRITVLVDTVALEEEEMQDEY